MKEIYRIFMMQWRNDTSWLYTEYFQKKFDKSGFGLHRFDQSFNLVSLKPEETHE